MHLPITNLCYFVSGQSRDSGMFPPIDTLSIDSHSDDAPPLPPRLYSNVSLFGNENDPNTSPDSEDGNFDMGVLQIFNDLFTFCSVCQTTPKKRNRNSKKWDKSPGKTRKGLSQNISK